MSSNKKRLTPKQIEEVYGIKSETIYWWLKNKTIPHSKIGKLVFIKAADIEHLLEVNEIHAQEIY